MDDVEPWCPINALIQGKKYLGTVLVRGFGQSAKQQGCTTASSLVYGLVYEA